MPKQKEGKRKGRIEKKKKNKGIDLFFILLTLFGVGLLVYPIISDYQLQKSQTMEIKSYQTKTAKLSKEDKEKKKAEFDQKNEDQKKGNAPLDDPFAQIEGKKQNNSVNVKKELLPDPVAILEIPKINLEIQVYPTSNDVALEEGVGVLEGTSLPSGGKGNHSVLTGHRGLSLGQMFTDLPNLKVKDHFYVTILGEIHAYEIDQLKTVTPDDLTYFDREDSEDYITLVTCTPLGINSHRLLVRGHRIPYVAAEKDTTNYWTMKTMLIVGISAVVLILFILIGIKKHKENKKEKKKKQNQTVKTKQESKKKINKAGGRIHENKK